MTELTQFIATLQQLLEKVSNPTPHPETPRQEDKEDASKIHFDNFNGKIESFTTYIQRLENLFDLHRIQATPDGNALRAKVLLNCIGTQYYQLLCSLCSPDLPTSKTYIEIVDVLTKHLCPRQNIDVAQFNFMKRSQTASETINSELITASTVAKETAQDEELSALLHSISTSLEYAPEYSTHKGVVLRGNRVVIPTSLRPQILQQLHSVHSGITKMKMIARNYVYWHGIDRDIENIAKSCAVCAKMQSDPVKVPIHSWEKPDAPWQRLHIDYAGPKDGKFYFVIIDSHSNWPEVFASNSAPNTELTIEYLREVFSRFGIPRIIVSDNATIFTSDRFTSFCSNNGIKQCFSAPGHPATNGTAERAVRTLKQRLAALADSPIPHHIKLHEILFTWRSTPLNSGSTPAELMLGRPMRTKFDILRPAQEKTPSGNLLPVTRKFKGGRKGMCTKLRRIGKMEVWHHFSSIW
ncbi:uncharacterized protein K02A2.6-like [Photinus pyralis]|uniref:uncharacterized protein K02A2.6-like n=1 Tax=Photinus pyralis TaxID=7054 RepID=UPI0012676EE4|nr:uncharacterized protein K02A2.6-like [Photinus pyralis]